MNWVESTLPSLKPKLLPIVGQCLSRPGRLTLVADYEAEDVFEVFFNVAGIKVKCLVDLSDNGTGLDTMLTFIFYSLT